MSNDSKSSSLPPSVGEFAIEDRQRLLGRIAELEEAIELADRGVANCELFRQRLAKYEDDEGRPVVQLSAEGYQEVATCLYVLREIGSLDADDISSDDIDLRFEDSEGRDTGCDVSIVEYAERSAVAIDGMLATLESQAREIVRLNSEAMYAAASYAAACEEIDRLKAQSSRVVLPDLLIEIQKRCLAGMDGAAVQAYGALNAIHAMIDEVDRLNSSPVSSGWVMPTAKQLEQALESVPCFHELSAELIAPAMLEHLRDVISAGEYGDAYQGAREDLAIWKRRALEAETKVREQDQIIDHLTLEAQGETRFGEPVISAGVVDERAAFPVEAHLWPLEIGVEAQQRAADAGCERIDCLHDGVQAMLAALTAPAPNHSEQVRVPEGWVLVPLEPTVEMLSAGRGISRWQYDDAIAAAPSAGSQEGDV